MTSPSRLILFFLLAVTALTLSLLGANENTGASTPKVEDFPAGVLIIRGEVHLEGRFVVISERKSSEPFVYSGNRISVTAGEARLELLLGGALNICRGSRMTVLQNHSPYLFSLESGSFSFEFPQSRGDTLFTPDFLIKTEPAESAATVPFRGEISLEPDGSLCVRSLSGDLRIALQSGGEPFTLRPGASVHLSPGKAAQQVGFENERCDCGRWPKAKSSILSFQPRPHQSKFLVTTKSVIRKLLHVMTLGWL